MRPTTMATITMSANPLRLGIFLSPRMLGINFRPRSKFLCLNPHSCVKSWGKYFDPLRKGLVPQRIPHIAKTL